MNSEQSTISIHFQSKQLSCICVGIREDSLLLGKGKSYKVKPIILQPNMSTGSRACAMNCSFYFCKSIMEPFGSVITESVLNFRIPYLTFRLLDPRQFNIFFNLTQVESKKVN